MCEAGGAECSGTGPGHGGQTRGHLYAGAGVPPTQARGPVSTQSPGAVGLLCPSARLPPGPRTKVKPVRHSP